MTYYQFWGEGGQKSPKPFCLAKVVSQLFQTSQFLSSGQTLEQHCLSNNIYPALFLLLVLLNDLKSFHININGTEKNYPKLLDPRIVSWEKVNHHLLQSKRYHPFCKETLTITWTQLHTSPQKTLTNQKGPEWVTKLTVMRSFSISLESAGSNSS